MKKIKHSNLHTNASKICSGSALNVSSISFVELKKENENCDAIAEKEMTQKMNRASVSP